MSPIVYASLGVSLTAMIASALRTAIIINRAEPGSRLSQVSPACWLTMFVSSAAFFTSLAAFIHLMPERVSSLLVYAFFGVSSTAILGAILLTAVLAAENGGLSPSLIRGFTKVTWTIHIGAGVMFFTSLAALIHLIA